MNPMIFDVFHEQGFLLTDTQLSALDMYYYLLLSWNEKFNLTAITEEKEVIYKHFLDSAQILSTSWIEPKDKVLDIGSGAGFPGVVLKILKPDLKVSLLEATAKKVGFLREVIQKCNLQKIEAIHGRAEEFAALPAYRGQFDIVVSRAVAPLNILSELSLPFVKINGKFLPMKGIQYDEELRDAKNALKLLGGKFIESYEYDILGQHRYILKIKKFQETGKKFPRKYGMMKKKPL